MTAVEAPTAEVVTVKVAVVAPAATVTLAGTVAAALLEESVTAIPPAGAGPLRVKVPLELLPPTTGLGVSEIEYRVGCPTMMLQVLVAEP